MSQSIGMKSQSTTEEAFKDPGQLTTHASYPNQDFQGHRQHSAYVDLHATSGGYRRPGYHHRRYDPNPRAHSGSSNGKSNNKRRGEFRPITPPSERVHFILDDDDRDGLHQSHPLFSELEELVSTGEDGEMEWRERARWIKFEEDVEEGGDRWSKPHVSTISLHSLFELRSYILNGTVMLDLEATSLDQIADLVLENMVNAGQLALNGRDTVKENLLRRHRHQHEKKHDRGHERSRLPTIRSLVDIGRSSSKSIFGSHKSLDKLSLAASRSGSLVDTSFSSSYTSPVLSSQWKPSFTNTAIKLFGQDEGSTNGPGGASPNGANVSNLPHSSSTASFHHLTATNVSAPTSNHQSGSSIDTGSTDLLHKANQAFMRKIPPDSEADNILVGELPFLERPISAFVRLSSACHLGDLTEVPVPTRFLFILLGPPSVPGRYHEIGRAMATIMSDDVFHDVAYKAKNRQDLLAGVDEFLDAVTVLPPGAWDPSIRIEPPQSVPSQEARKRDHAEEKQLPDEDDQEAKEREANGLTFTGRLFGGLINDVKRKAPWYWSDFKDAFALQSLATIFFLYFACLAPIITFGGLLGEATGQNIATMESLLTGAICGILYGLFSGQPLTILGSTGPVLVFETIMYDFCSKYGFDYLSVRMWIGLWTGGILIALVASDASSLVCYITRFTEENFATLISVIFIYKAVEKVLLIGSMNPIKTRDSSIDYWCSCVTKDTTMSVIQSSQRNESVMKACVEEGGSLYGSGCNTPNYVPDVFLFSIILFVSTYMMSLILKDFKSAPFFPARVRAIISDFAVVIAILSMTAADYAVGINTPKLNVPQEFKPTSKNRDWLFNPFPENNPWWTPLVAVVPALLCTILIFMDQQITAVIVNRKENKLKKGCGYHLDLLIVAILIIICSVLGLPWFVAATVLSMTHVNTLRMESECAAPGEKPQFLGVREQRLTHIMIFVLVGVSVFLTQILKHIPMPVLFGVFLYMGTSSLKGSQMFARIIIIFMPQKYQPDFIFLRQVPIGRVHLFTAIQITCFICLWVVKSYKPSSIAFPLMLVVMIGVRKLLDFVFTQRELKILDDVMPEHTRKAIEEKKTDDSSSSGAPTGSDIPATDESSGNVSIPLANGNILRIPVGKFSSPANDQNINISEQLLKSTAWKTIDQGNLKSPSSNGTKSKEQSNRNSKPNERKKETQSVPEKTSEAETQKTSEDDEDDDCGITIKIDSPTRLPSNHPNHASASSGSKGETRI